MICAMCDCEIPKGQHVVLWLDKKVAFICQPCSDKPGLEDVTEEVTGKKAKQ